MNSECFKGTQQTSNSRNMPMELNNLQELLDVFEKEMRDNKGLVDMTRTCVRRHTTRAFGVGAASEVHISSLNGAPERLASHLRNQGSSKSKVKNNKYYLKFLLDWGKARGFVPTGVSEEVSKTWQATVAHLKPRSGAYPRSSWQALATWASGRGLGPAHIQTASLLEFAHWLHSDKKYTKWRQTYRRLACDWQRASRQGKLHDLVFPRLPHKWPRYTLPFGEWPSEMQQDYEEYRNWCTAEFSPGRLRRNKQRQTTARSTLGSIQRIAGYAVNIRGMPRCELSFIGLLDEGLVREFVCWLKTERCVSELTIHKYLHTLSSIGLRYLGLGGHELAWLSELKQQVGPPRLGDKSDKMISYEELVSVPDRLRRERLALEEEMRRRARRRRKKLSGERLTQMQKRLAWMHSKEFIVRFAIVTVLRTRNILEATLDKNVKRRSDGTWQIHFEGTETKAGNVLTFDLPPFLGFYLDEYLNEARPILDAGENSNLLFVTTEGRPLYKSALWHTMRNACLRYFGKAISPHTIRSIVGTGLRRRGVDVFDIAKILGHKNVRTTMQSYILCEMNESMKRHHVLLKQEFDVRDFTENEDTRVQGRVRQENTSTQGSAEMTQKETAVMRHSIGDRLHEIIEERNRPEFSEGSLRHDESISSDLVPHGQAFSGSSEAIRVESSVTRQRPDGSPELSIQQDSRERLASGIESVSALYRSETSEAKQSSQGGRYASTQLCLFNWPLQNEDCGDGEAH